MMTPTEEKLVAARDELIATRWVAFHDPESDNERQMRQTRIAFARSVLDYQAERVMLIQGRSAEELKAAINPDQFDSDHRPMSLHTLAALRQLVAAGSELAKRIEKGDNRWLPQPTV